MDSIPSEIAADLAGIIVCLFFSALFSWTETTLTGISESRALHLGERFPFARGWLNHWNDHTARVLTSLLVGNNVVNIAASVLGTRLAYALLTEHQEVTAVLGLTLIVLIFGEVTPKTLAKQQGEFLIPFAAAFGRMVDLMFFPVAYVLQLLAQSLLAATGTRMKHPEEPMVTRDEIEYMIELGHKEGVLEEAHGDLLTSVISFSETLVREVMVPRTHIAALPITAKLDEARELAARTGHSRIPIYRDSLDNIVGVLFVKDLLTALAAGASAVGRTVESVARTRFQFVPETQKVSVLLKELQIQRLHLAIVVDEYGGTSGIITLEDILEELVGDIRDEHGREEDPVAAQPDGTWLVSGHVAVEDLSEAIGVELPEAEDYTTVAGLLLSLHEGVPLKGETVAFDNIDFTVIDGNARVVRKVKVQVKKPAAPAEDAAA